MKQLKLRVLLFIVMSTLVLVGCSQKTAVSPTGHTAENEAAILPLPELTAANLHGRPLKNVDAIVGGLD